MKYFSENEEDTMLFGKKYGKTAEIGDVFCLIGGLGAGKTVFSKGFALGMGIDAQIVSPTFAFVNEYDGRRPLYHFDAYRLESPEAAACFDFMEYFESGVCLIEWAENIWEILPEHAVFFLLERVEEKPSARQISVYSRSAFKALKYEERKISNKNSFIK